MPKTFHIITLGCKVNQYESEALREAWLAAGHREEARPDGADLVLINSCAITAKAVSDLRNLARRVRAASPECELLITGCAAQALPDEIADLPIDAVMPQSCKPALLACPEDMADFWAGAAPAETPTAAKSSFPALAINGYARSRAVLKVHDGCSQHCTYCIVPQGRGPSVSRPWPESVAEAGRLIRAGFREIMLSGVNLRQYGADLTPREDFWALLARLEAAFAAEWAGKLRLRISSLEPGQLGARGLETLSASRLAAPHLHLSIQSGSPRILKRMGRGHYDPAAISVFLNGLAQIWPVFGLGADFITGFPGESEEDFSETMALAAKLPLTYAHVFPYSRRPGTAAAKLPGQLAPEVGKKRAARLRALIGDKKDAFLRRQLGLAQVTVAPEAGRARGVNEFYADCRFADKNSGAGKELVQARPLKIEKHVLVVQRLATSR